MAASIYLPSDIEEAARLRGESAIALYPDARWISTARIYRDGAFADHEVYFNNSRMRTATLSDVTLVDAHFPIVGDRLLYWAMHHNAEQRLAPLLTSDGTPSDLLRRRLRFTSFKRPRRGLHFLVGGDASSFWHFLYNCLLRLSVVAESSDAELRDRARLVIAHDVPGPFADILGALGFDPSRIVTARSTAAERFEALAVCEMPFYFKTSNLELFAAREATGFLRERIAPPKRRDRRIYISRGDASWRRVANEAELKPILAEYGFTIVELKGLPGPELISLMNEAELVIGASGSNLGATLFCQPGATIVELSYEPFSRKYYFQGGSSMGGLRHLKIEGTPVDQEGPYIHWDFVISPKDLIEVLELSGFRPRSEAAGG